MPQKRPNILFIMSDNHAADLLGCYGNQEIHSPNLDRLAGEGMRFDNAFCANAMCSPCRATTLTGLMPSQHGVHTWLDDRVMDRWPAGWNAVGEFRTLPQILKENGYRTALIGKYHLGMPEEPQNGFDRWVTFSFGHTQSFWNQTIIEDGESYTYPGHTVDCFTEKAIETIQKQEPESEEPFFLFLTYNGPYGHWPSIKGPARNRFYHLYQDTEMHSVPREGVSKEMIDRFLLRRSASGGGIDYSVYLQIPNDLTTLRNFYSQLSMVDDGVGRVLAALDEKGLSQDTLVIYSCDHAFSLGHNGFWGHGQVTWPANAHRAAYHIPLLMRQPGRIKPDQNCDRMIGQVDLFATILDYAGLSNVQANDNSPSQSFAPLLEGEEDGRPNEIYIEQEEVRAIRTPGWLYVKRFQGSQTYPLGDALYDLVNDPEEKANLVDEPGFAEIGRELSARIDAYFDQYADPKYDLWQGGSPKSNTDKPWLWNDVWGEEWGPNYGS